MAEKINMEEIRKRVQEHENENSSKEEEALAYDLTVEQEEKSVATVSSTTPPSTMVGITKNVVSDKLAQIIYTTDANKTVSEQIEEAAEVGATVKAVENEAVQDMMANAKGEQLIETVKEKAATARAGRVKAETEEQKAKKEQNEAMLGIFNADKHYPEWFRKIVIALFTPFYLLLLLIIGVPTGIIRFTLDCIDGILVRYEDVDEKRKPKVRVTFWILLIVAVISAVLFPLLKYFQII